MTDNGDGPAESGSTEGERTDGFESEHTATRAEAAAVLRGLADGVDAGALSIGAGEDAATAAVPDEFDFELEFERDDDEVEIEVELEWTAADEPAMDDVVPADEPAGGTESGGESAATDDVDESERDADESASEASPGDESASEVAPGEDRPAVETATVESADGADAATAESGDGSDEGATPSADDAVATPAVEAVAPLVSQARFEVFRDRASEWRWRLVHRNGNVIATSGEGYTRKHNAEKGLQSVIRNAPDAAVVEDD